jgi:dihydroorotase-like cyclic amidohydrolase
MGRRLQIPAMVDPHVHLRGMDWAHKGDFYSETCAAVAGGYWAVFDMPNTEPATISRAALDRKLHDFSRGAVCDWGVYFGAAMNGNWSEYGSIIDDVCGLKIFNNSTTGNLLIDDQSVREAHYQYWPPHKVIAVHAEEETILELLELVRKYRKHTHFLHISSANEIRYLRAAKEEGLPVSIGVCPHHLWLTENDLSTRGSYGIMKPGLKTADDRDVLWQALADGLVDVIESDHAPHTTAEKDSEHPPYGVPGLETTLPLLLTAVHEGRLTLDQVSALVSDNPRHLWGLECPEQTYTVIDLDESYVIDRGNLHTRCGWSPFEGMRVQGRVVETWIRGVQVYDGERVMVAPGFGVNLYA